MQIPAHYTPRPYQLRFLRDMVSVRFAVLCWSRRMGKDMTCFAYAIKRMVEEPMNVVLIFPTKKQGFKAFWRNIENDGFKTIEHIPKSLIASSSNTENEMIITLKNGSSFMLLGASDPEALRGANGKLYILSEFVDIDSEVLNVIRPITALNGGQIIIQSTPKLDGISGGTFKSLFDAAKKDEGQLASYVPATEYLNEAQLDVIRKDYVMQNGNDFMFSQEMLLDWGQASSTSYYGEVLSAMEKSGRIGLHSYDARYPVYTSWDLGMADSTAIVFWQYYNKKLTLIDAYETHDIGDEPIVRFVQSKPYNYAWHFLPHDGAKRDSDAVSRIQKIRDYGLVNASLLKRADREMGIKKTVELLRNDDTSINEVTLVDAIEKLKKYKRKFNGVTGDYEGPDHTTESHIADALRYCAEAIDQSFDPKTGRFFYDNSGKELSTHSEQLVSTNMYEEYDEYGDWSIADNWDV